MFVRVCACLNICFYVCKYVRVCLYVCVRRHGRDKVLIKGDTVKTTCRFEEISYQVERDRACYSGLGLGSVWRASAENNGRLVALGTLRRKAKEGDEKVKFKKKKKKRNLVIFSTFVTICNERHRPISVVSG